MCSNSPSSSAKWFSLAKWWYNTNYHIFINCTPYEVVYGQPPPLYLPYLPEESKSQTVDRSLISRDEAIKLLKFHLLKAQIRQAQHADRKRTEHAFSLGDFVFLKLHPYKQHTLRHKPFNKLLPKFYGSFKVTEKIGHTAYQLELPPNASIHNVFHVSQLKLCPNPTATSMTALPAFAVTIGATLEPESLLDRKMVKQGRVAATKVLVKWKARPPEQATWEYYYDLLLKFPNIHPCGQGWSSSLGYCHRITSDELG